MTEPAYLPRTRTAYDAVAVEYAALFSGALPTRPLDRAMLAAFTELVRAATGERPVADLGCGPGHITAHLHALGLTAFGVDLSPEMIAIARRAYPDLRFDEGSMTDLDLADGVLGGVVAWYSVIHTPPEAVPGTFAEFGRMIAPGGHLLLGFLATDEPGDPPRAFDHKVTLAYRWSPEWIKSHLQDAGFAEVARLLCEPAENERRFPQASLLARRTG